MDRDRVVAIGAFDHHGLTGAALQQAGHSPTQTVAENTQSPTNPATTINHGISL